MSLAFRRTSSFINKNKTNTRYSDNYDKIKREKYKSSEKMTNKVIKTQLISCKKTLKVDRQMNGSTGIQPDTFMQRMIRIAVKQTLKGRCVLYKEII